MARIHLSAAVAVLLSSIGRAPLAVAITEANSECDTATSSSPASQRKQDILDANDGVTRGTYGVDTSWPIHHHNVSRNFAWLPHNMNPDDIPTPPEFEGVPIQPLDDRATIYEDFMQGCRDYYGKRGNRCDAVESDRIRMSLSQPKKMTNYTALGFKKIRAPEGVFKLIKDFWDDNKHQGKLEKWGTGYTYTNHWHVNSTMVSVEDTDMIGGGSALKDAIWNMAEDTISEWVGRSLQTSSLYGIRVYYEDAVLATHVDRLPLVSSAIINVDQDPDMEEDWPLEVYGHDGKVYNVTMKPGDMVLYESHSVLHGRPFALKGKYYANIFVHFEPVPLDNPGRLAQLGDLDMMQRAAEVDHQILFRKDSNGWQPLHEAVRGGHVDVVEYLLGEGADIDSPTSGGRTALDWALDVHGEGHVMVEFLRRHGGHTQEEMSEQAQDEHDEL